MDDVSIILEEASFIVLNKPTGLLSQSTYGVESLLFRIRAHLKRRDGSDREPFIELPHRLDRGTSGVLLAAKTKSALSCLSEQFHFRKTTKSYLVAVQGHPTKSLGTWTDWMRKIPDVSRAEMVAEDSDGSRQATLDYEQIYRDETNSIVRVALKTGRMHQIRLQFASRGMPVLGDQAYGSTIQWSPAIRHEHDEHFALHAHWLAFRHPKDGREIRVEAPLPDAWHERFPSECLGERRE
ncbi:MAG: RluA family pseudouridine synthase [Pirellulaceae bacterium]|nr:RluA family pseudouridine synthase [Pirellulaceae bacterium]